MQIRIQLITLMWIQMQMQIKIFILCRSGFLFDMNADPDTEPTLHSEADPNLDPDPRFQKVPKYAHIPYIFHLHLQIDVDLDTDYHFDANLDPDCT
jgi:hypothetical protein